MIRALPGDNITQGEAEQLAIAAECPSSNICRYCGIEIVVMAFTMTGACCNNHAKLRYDPTLDLTQNLPITDVQKG